VKGSISEGCGNYCFVYKKKQIGSDCKFEERFKWEDFEQLASTAISGTYGKHKVVVKNNGGTFGLYATKASGRYGAKGQVNTLFVFNTTENVTLAGTDKHQTQGPSVLAPFASVTLQDSIGVVDGFLVAKDVQGVSTKEASLMQLQGNAYTGPIECKIQ